MIEVEKINQNIQRVDWKNLNDVEYVMEWEKINDYYMIFLIKLEELLYNKKSTAFNDRLFDLTIEAEKIGIRTGNYWNKISKELLKIFEAGII